MFNRTYATAIGASRPAPARRPLASRTLLADCIGAGLSIAATQATLAACYKAHKAGRALPWPNA